MNSSNVVSAPFKINHENQSNVLALHHANDRPEGVRVRRAAGGGVSGRGRGLTRLIPANGPPPPKTPSETSRLMTSLVSPPLFSDAFPFRIDEKDASSQETPSSLKRFLVFFPKRYGHKSSHCRQLIKSFIYRATVFRCAVPSSYFHAHSPTSKSKIVLYHQSRSFHSFRPSILSGLQSHHQRFSLSQSHFNSPSFSSHLTQ